MPVAVSDSAIDAFLRAIPDGYLASTPPTNLPTTLPLAWPSDLHRLNFLTVLHLTYTVLAQPSHTLLLAERRTRAADVALRGCLALYLASEPAWDADNLLSARAWADDKLTEATVAESFGITIMRERQHESLPITVGERYPPAVAAVGDLCGLFSALGAGVSESCIGEEVAGLLTVSSEHTATEPDPAKAYAKDFCHRVAPLLPLLNTQSSAEALPAAPLRLLQDVTHVFGPKGTYPLPDAAGLADASPLPLPPAVLLHLGILRAGDLGVLGEWDGKDAIFSSDKNVEGAELRIAYVGKERFDALSEASVRACTAIRERARSKGQEMTFFDVARMVCAVDERMDARGDGVRVVLKT